MSTAPEHRCVTLTLSVCRLPRCCCSKLDSLEYAHSTFWPDTESQAESVRNISLCSPGLHRTVPRCGVAGWLSVGRAMM